MKIMLVANAYPPHFIGGAEIAAHRQAVELVGRGHELSCFCAYSDPVREAYAYSVENVDGVTVRRVNVPANRFGAEENFANPVVDQLFRDFLAEIAPEVVHFHNLPGLSLGLLDVCEDADLPSMVTFHDHWGFCLRNTLVREGETRVCPDWSECHVCLGSALMDGVRIPTFIRTDFIRLKLHKARLFHFPSQYLQDAYEKAFFDTRRAVRHTYGLSPTWFEPPLPSERSDRIRCAFVGYFGAHKGPQVLMAALELLEARGILSRLQVDLFGHGVMEAELRDWIARRGWEGRVAVRGRVDNAGMAAVYRGADVMLNCSLWPENEPVTILESLASGTPVIATRLGGNIELVRDGENGWLYDPASPEALAAVMERVAGDREKLAAARPRARDSVADKTLKSYGDFALDAYASMRGKRAVLPSLIAATDIDASSDFAALWRASKTGYWSRAEWVRAEALHGPAEQAAVVAAIALDGGLPRAFRDAPLSATPVVVVGEPRPRGSGLGGREGVMRVEGLDELTSLGDFMDTLT